MDARLQDVVFRRTSSKTRWDSDSGDCGVNCPAGICEEALSKERRGSRTWVVIKARVANAIVWAAMMILVFRCQWAHYMRHEKSRLTTSAQPYELIKTTASSIAIAVISRKSMSS